MNDITEQRTKTEAFAPPADSELHKIPVLKDEEEYSGGAETGSTSA